MEYREKIVNVEGLKKVMELAAEIQNKGIATVFINFYGHINEISVDICSPKWVPSSQKSTPKVNFCADTGIGDNPHELQKILDGLSNILSGENDLTVPKSKIANWGRF